MGEKCLYYLQITILLRRLKRYKDHLYKSRRADGTLWNSTLNRLIRGTMTIDTNK